jgi:two-component system KDP operon response regulator KdpE
MRSKQRARRHPDAEARRPDEQDRRLVAADTLVMIVDDDRDVAFSVADVLSMEGYSTRHCPTAEAALLQIATDLHPSLVILDLWIPTMGSSAFARRLRAVSPSTPVLLLSGSARDLQRTAIDADAMLVKPFEATTLVRIVDTLAMPRATGRRSPAKSRPRGDGAARLALPRPAR